MNKWLTKNQYNIKFASLFLTVVLSMGWVVWEFVMKSPDERRIEIVCIFGYEYIYFASGYKAVLASRWGDDGELMRCVE